MGPGPVGFRFRLIAAGAVVGLAVPAGFVFALERVATGRVAFRFARPGVLGSGDFAAFGFARAAVGFPWSFCGLWAAGLLLAGPAGFRFDFGLIAGFFRLARFGAVASLPLPGFGLRDAAVLFAFSFLTTRFLSLAFFFISY